MLSLAGVGGAEAENRVALGRQAVTVFGVHDKFELGNAGAFSNACPVAHDDLIGRDPQEVDYPNDQ